MTAILLLIRQFWPYVLVGAMSFSGAWYIQGLRLTAQEQTFEQYKIEEQKQSLEAIQDANKQRDLSSSQYSSAKSQLDAERNTNAAYRRCVAAGKCGAISMQSCPSSQTNNSPPPNGTDAASTDTVPTTGQSAAEESTPPVVNECAGTTLQLNKLQEFIEGQRGY